jgi:hypothetical protein
MSLKASIVILVFAALPVLAALQALAQTPVARRHVEITPRPLLYRRCTDWYELQYRPSGTVLYPQKHCWWVRG